ncbi:hypothetical protein [Nocardiopsis sp. ATB16-24]|uniref:hypothetical protein n=1 Tax=Nocardiopsis sp. ATB16-24 TaxID=3019555 RepID=UPI002553BB4D|nr:hypothetical protein [Nocardiopsis sp. ATB16-24]
MSSSNKIIAAILTLTPALLLTSCSIEDPGEGTPREPTDKPSSSYVSFIWVERQLMVATLERMFTENGEEEVIKNIEEDSMKMLTDARIIRPKTEGYYVETNEREWRLKTAPSLNQLDQALYNSFYPNEVTWCEENMNGEDFIDSYTREFQQAFDTVEEYEESIADYVDCGTGRL